MGGPRACIAVSGLPASGKSTVGRTVAAALGFRYLDKDDVLERLFDERGVGDPARRARLSRESDRAFETRARSLSRVVLVSHWRAPGSSSPSGTPAEWLAETFQVVVELHCACPVGTAARRFTRRRRHPGHLDRTRSRGEVEAWMVRYAEDLPLGLGMLIEVDTATGVDVEGVLSRLRPLVRA